MIPILIVDDSADDLRITQRELIRAGIVNPIFIENSGENCLEFFRDPQSPNLPCIALIDMVMAPLSGLDCLRALNQMPSAKRSVLIMLSGQSSFQKVSEGYALGAATFLMKPLNSEEIITSLSNLRQLRAIQRDGGIEFAIA